MNLAGYVKCLKSHALNKKISDEEFLNAVLATYIIAGKIDNKKASELYFDKSRTSLILNRHEDVPVALRKALTIIDIHILTEENFEDFIKDYMNPKEIPIVIKEITEMIEAIHCLSGKSPY